MRYTIQDNIVSFSQSKMPRLLFVLFGQFGVYITVTGNKLLPYSVTMTEEDFLVYIELAKGDIT